MTRNKEKTNKEKTNKEKTNKALFTQGPEDGFPCCEPSGAGAPK